MKHTCLIAFLVCTVHTTVLCTDTLHLDIREAVNIALQHNFDVQIARQDSLLALNVGDSHITGFLPTLNLNGNTSTGQTNIRQNIADGRVIKQNGASVSTLSGNVVLGWTVFDGLKMFANSTRMKALESEGLARVRATMQTVVADVVSTFNGLVAYQRFLSTVDSALVLAEQRYAIAQRQYDVGTNSGVELAQARIDLNTQKALAISMKAQAEVASSALMTLLGRTPTSYIIADSALPDINLPGMAELEASVDTLNPDLIALQRSLEAASAHVSETNAAFMPKLGVSATYQFNQSKQSAGFILDNQTAGWNVGAQLQWNIFNGMSDQIARDRALIEQTRAEINVAALRTSLKGQIDRAYRNYDAANRQYQLEQASFIEAQRNATVAVDGLSLGTANALEVRQSLLTLLDVGERAARRDYERRLAATEILRLAGRLVR